MVLGVQHGSDCLESQINKQESASVHCRILIANAQLTIECDSLSTFRVYNCIGVTDGLLLLIFRCLQFCRFERQQER